MVGVPLTSLRKVEVKVLKINPLERVEEDIGRVERKGGGVERGGEVEGESEVVRVVERMMKVSVGKVEDKWVECVLDWAVTALEVLLLSEVTAVVEVLKYGMCQTRTSEDHKPHKLRTLKAANWRKVLQRV